MRFDSGCWSNETISLLEKLEVRCSTAIGTDTKAIKGVIEEIAEDAWIGIPCTPGGEAAVAETT